MSAEEIKQKSINDIMKNNPCGLLVVPGKSSVQLAFWQRPAPAENILWENTITGLCQNAVESKRLTKEEIIAAIERVVK